MLAAGGFFMFVTVGFPLLFCIYHSWVHCRHGRDKCPSHKVELKTHCFHALHSFSIHASFGFVGLSDLVT